MYKITAKNSKGKEQAEFFKTEKECAEGIVGFIEDIKNFNVFPITFTEFKKNWIGWTKISARTVSIVNDEFVFKGE